MQRDFWGWVVVAIVVLLAVDRAAQRGYFKKGARLIRKGAKGLMEAGDAATDEVFDEAPEQESGGAEPTVGEERMVANEVVKAIEQTSFTPRADREETDPPVQDNFLASPFDAQEIF